MRNVKFDLTSLNVGDADCSIIRTTGGETIVIDTDRVQHVDKIKEELGGETIDHLFVTHPDGDHCYGARDLIESGYAKNVYAPPPDRVEIGNLGQGGKAFYNAEANFGDPEDLYEVTTDNTTIDATIDIEVLSPPSDIDGSGLPETDKNEHSLVLQISDDEKTHLLTGDIGRQAEEYICEQYRDQLEDVDVLHASHHGATYSEESYQGGTKGNTGELLDATNPSVVVISNDLETNGHPDPRLLKRCSERNIGVAWTAVHGDIDEQVLTTAQAREPEHDPQELLKVRSVRSSHREEAMEELVAEGNVDISNYPIDTKIFKAQYGQNGSGRNIQKEELQQWIDSNLEENIKLGAVSESDIERAQRQFQQTGEIDLDQYDLQDDITDPKSEYNFSIKESGSENEEQGPEEDIEGEIARIDSDEEHEAAEETVNTPRASGVNFENEVDAGSEVHEDNEQREQVTTETEESESTGLDSTPTHESEVDDTNPNNPGPMDP